MKDKSAYGISSFMNEETLEAVISGEVTEATYEEVLHKVNDMIKSSRVECILWDLRSLKGRYGLGGLYHRARSYSMKHFHIHNAIVDLQENADFESRYENEAIHAGLSFKWFTDINEARAWLKSNLKKNNIPHIKL